VPKDVNNEDCFFIGKNFDTISFMLKKTYFMVCLFDTKAIIGNSLTGLVYISGYFVYE